MRRVAALLEERQLALVVSVGARDLLALDGYDPAFGARPLKRAIQRRVIDPLAMKILDGTFHPGDTVFVNASGGSLELSTTPESAVVH